MNDHRFVCKVYDRLGHSERQRPQTRAEAPCSKAHLGKHSCALSVTAQLTADIILFVLDAVCIRQSTADYNCVLIVAREVLTDKNQRLHRCSVLVQTPTEMLRREVSIARN